MTEFRFSRNGRIPVLFDEQADEGIFKIWKKVEKDIGATTGAACERTAAVASGEQAILICTEGQGLAKALEKRIPELAGLSGKWESYGFYLIRQPLPGIEKGLVIAGSDKLGTIYGMFHLSELLGVTAWGFWGDIAPPVWDEAALFSQQSCESPCGEALEEKDADKKEQAGKVCRAVVKNGISKEPSVKFRGFFINDEWPCFGNWTTSHYQGFNAQMYDHVFEYLLRMKGNYLWPAMWSSSFLLDGPGLASMELATEYGIYIGMSHHEPCMRSGEEFSRFKGEGSIYGNEWDYAANKEGILRFWTDGLSRVKGQRIFPTVGMRGERDSRLLGPDSTVEENVRLLKEIITNQRRLIREQIHPDIDKTPQLFAVYKEVEDYYFGNGEMEGIRGFEELENVTLLFCEDNHGNMRALPQGEERRHPGGFGMYYHVDYHGAPISYEWVNSTPISKIWEQMTQAYEYGVQKLWIVNVGDVKFQEYPLGYFLSLAYDYDAWSAPNKTKEYTRAWVQSLFGSYVTGQQAEKIAWVLEESVRLHSQRRAEALNDAVYHPAHYGEADRMLKWADALEAQNEELMDALAGTPCADGYFSTIYYPAAGIANLLKMHLYAAKNHLYAAQGRAAANWYGEKMRECIGKDRALAQRMAEFSDGKWKGMELASHIGFVNWNDEDWRYPVQHVVTLPESPRLTVSRADSTKTYTNQYFPQPIEIDDFLWPGGDTVRIQIANGGKGVLAWEIEGTCDWLSFSSRKGETECIDEVDIRVLRERIKEPGRVEFSCRIRTERESVPLHICAQNRDFSVLPENTYLVRNGICALDAADFCEKRAGRYGGQEAGFALLEDYGKFGSGMKVFPTLAEFTPKEAETKDAPSLTYRVYCETGGSYELELHTSPANPLHYGGKLTLLVSANEAAAQTVNLTGDHYHGGDGSCKKWADAVLNQEHAASAEAELKAGLNSITVYAQEAGLVLERLVLYKKDVEKKKSYLGPQPEAPVK